MCDKWHKALTLGIFYIVPNKPKNKDTESLVLLMQTGYKYVVLIAQQI